MRISNLSLTALAAALSLSLTACTSNSVMTNREPGAAASMAALKAQNEYVLPADTGNLQVLEYFLCGKKSAAKNEDGILTV